MHTVLTIRRALHSPRYLLDPQATDAVSLLPCSNFAHVELWSVNTVIVYNILQITPHSGAIARKYVTIQI